MKDNSQLRQEEAERKFNELLRISLQVESCIGNNSMIQYSKPLSELRKEVHQHAKDGTGYNKAFDEKIAVIKCIILKTIGNLERMSKLHMLISNVIDQHDLPAELGYHYSRRNRFRMSVDAQDEVKEDA